jgi:hypothetical protein
LKHTFKTKQLQSLFVQKINCATSAYFVGIGKTCLGTGDRRLGRQDQPLGIEDRRLGTQDCLKEKKIGS